MALYFRSFRDFPLVVAANRDERYDRAAIGPRLIESNPAIIAGRDLRAGGTWLGVNGYGVVVAVLNRRTQGAAAAPRELRSRGLLCLDLLRSTSASSAAEFLVQDRFRYQPFTLVIADEAMACSAANRESGIDLAELAPGLHVFNNRGTQDAPDAKCSRAYALFRAWRPDRSGGSGSWIGPLKALLGDHFGNGSSDPTGALCVHGEVSGTVSSSIIVCERQPKQARFYYCPGPPCENSFDAPLDLPIR
ncbi:MAG TPA: NRDE family protein [Candidatus Eisenbacteria bacterium]|nr:NRDE family protein [Candidatus Eisenbacteria bacterium]